MPNSCRMNKLAIPGLAMLLLSCDTPVQKQHVPQPDPVSEQFIRANQYMLRRHQDHIAAFVERVGWNAEVTPTGLWIVIEEPGNGERITDKSVVTYSFSSTLLDGTACYQATESDPKQIVIGRGGVESGVEEGMRHLRRGSRAIFIIPPHLGHGNFGDRDKIPGNSVIIYRVKITEVLNGS
jgi:FKBP-type peptidyl-prolyl cis-trans isomerase FkpA